MYKNVRDKGIIVVDVVAYCEDMLETIEDIAEDMRGVDWEGNLSMSIMEEFTVWDNDGEKCGIGTINVNECLELMDNIRNRAYRRSIVDDIFDAYVSEIVEYAEKGDYISVRDLIDGVTDVMAAWLEIENSWDIAEDMFREWLRGL